jgi:hypothetical protein
VKTVPAPTVPATVTVPPCAWSAASDALAAQRATETPLSALFLGPAGGRDRCGRHRRHPGPRTPQGDRSAAGAGRQQGEIGGQFLTGAVALSCLGGLRPPLSQGIPPAPTEALTAA